MAYSTPKIFVKGGQFYFKLSSKMWSRFFGTQCSYIGFRFTNVYYNQRTRPLIKRGRRLLSSTYFDHRSWSRQYTTPVDIHALKRGASAWPSTAINGGGRFVLQTYSGVIIVDSRPVAISKPADIGRKLLFFHASPAFDVPVLPLGTYTYPTQMRHYEWSWVTFSEIYDDTKHTAASLRQLSFL